MVELTDAQRNEILDHIFAGQKLNAIKVYREATGLSLLAAKEFIEKLTTELEENTPHHFSETDRNRGSGCLGVVLVCAFIAYLMRTIL